LRHRCEVMTLTPCLRAILLCSFPCVARSFACASFVAISILECLFFLAIAFTLPRRHSAQKAVPFPSLPVDRSTCAREQKCAQPSGAEVAAGGGEVRAAAPSPSANVGVVGPGERGPGRVAGRDRAALEEQVGRLFGWAPKMSWSGWCRTQMGRIPRSRGKTCDRP
jgi:hypothetical protein